LPDPFKSARLKLVQAQRHLRKVAAIERRLRTSSKRKVIPQETNDPEFFNFILRLPKPRLSMGLAVGDSLHNLRSALDHIVFAIAEVTATKHGRSRSAIEQRRSAFPIHIPPPISLPDFEARYRKKDLNGIPVKAMEFIHGFQPTNTGDPFWLLNELENIDKHRELHLFAVSTPIIEFDVGGVVWSPSNALVRLRDGDTVGGQRIADIKRVNIKAQIPVLVTFHDGIAVNVPVASLLEQILKLTRDTILPGLEPFAR
jgi:hypothetical protein